MKHSKGEYSKFGTALLISGDLLPIFIVGIIYEFSYNFRLGEYLFLLLLAISVIGNIAWYFYIRETLKSTGVPKNSNGSFKKIDEKNSIFTSYVISLLSILPAIILKGYLGIEIFIVIIVFLFLAYANTDIIVLNPLLVIFRYKLFIAEFENDELYIFSKEKLTFRDFKDSPSILFYQVINNLYIVEKPQEV